MSDDPATNVESVPPRPRLLDLFCGAGGAAVGYHRAGFDVVGVDIEPQPHYPFQFHQADALAMVQDRLHGCWHEGTRTTLPGRLAACLGHFDAIHASPPCQLYSDLGKRNGNAGDWPDHVPAVRALLVATGLPFVIENVEGAPLIDPVRLCGTMFPGLRVLRHRLFESNVALVAPEHGRHPLVFTHDKRKAHHGLLDQDTAYVQVTGGGNCTVSNARSAMGIDWMTKDELNEAIPPAYTEHVGRQLASAVELRRVAAVTAPIEPEAGVQRIAAERQRQIEAEGWTPEHDDEHIFAYLSRAALSYAEAAVEQVVTVHRDGRVVTALEVETRNDWPWDYEWWKPSDDPIRNLEKAGALIAAEIDRLLRNRGNSG